MQKKTFVVKKENGLTSRASAALVSEANKFKADIKLFCNDEVADVKSIMNVMGLIIKKDYAFTITCDGIDEEHALERIEIVLKDTRVI